MNPEPQNTVYISFSAEITVVSAEQLMGVIFNQINEGADHIYLLFSTQGGMVDQGIALYNSLKGIPAKLTVHNVGNVDSAGNVVFLAGHRRFACLHATFMFHGLHWNFYQQQLLRRNDLNEILGNLSAGETKMAGIISDETSLKLEEVEGFFVNAQTFDSGFALDKGIAHEIRDVAVPRGAPMYQIVIGG